MKNPRVHIWDDARNDMYIQGIIADIFYCRLSTWQSAF